MDSSSHFSADAPTLIPGSTIVLEPRSAPESLLPSSSSKRGPAVRGVSLKPTPAGDEKEERLCWGTSASKSERRDRLHLLQLPSFIL